MNYFDVWYAGLKNMYKRWDDHEAANEGFILSSSQESTCLDNDDYDD